MSELDELKAALDVAAARLADLDFAQLSDTDLCATTTLAEQHCRTVDAARLLLAAEIEHRSRFELGPAGLSYRLGHRRGVHLIEHLTRTSQRDATRRIRLGTAIAAHVAPDGTTEPPLRPQLATALRDGNIGMDAAAHVMRALEQASHSIATPEQLDSAEASLCAAALTLPSDDLGAHARAWRELTNPDGAPPRDEELHLNRRFSFGAEIDGMTPFSGLADPRSAALLRAAFAERAHPRVHPRFLGDEERDPAEPLHDPRTREQRYFDIFVGLVTAGTRVTDSAPGGLRSLTTVMAVITLDDLRKGRGVGWLDDVGEPVSAQTIAELACDAGVRRILLGDNGEPLWLGTPERYFSPAQRRALAVRDGGCTWINGCHAPPMWCHAHHVVEYAEGGATDVDNGALLCAEHHHMLHSSGFRMKMVNGRPYMLAPPHLDPGQSWRPVGRSRLSVVAYRETA